MKRALAVVAFAGALAFATVADAAVSRFKPARGVDRDALAAYQVVVVDELDDKVKRRKEDAAEEAAFRADIADVSGRIADRIAAKLEESGKYEAVQRDGTADPALLLDGRITVFKRANLASRYVGLGGGSKFEGVVILKDAATGKQLGTIELEFSSSGIPGVTNLVQTIGVFIEGIAVRVANEVLIAQGKLHRAETGRTARLREKYRD